MRRRSSKRRDEKDGGKLNNAVGHESATSFSSFSSDIFSQSSEKPSSLRSHGTDRSRSRSKEKSLRSSSRDKTVLRSSTDANHASFSQIYETDTGNNTKMDKLHNSFAGHHHPVDVIPSIKEGSEKMEDDDPSKQLPTGNSTVSKATEASEANTGEQDRSKNTGAARPAIIAEGTSQLENSDTVAANATPLAVMKAAPATKTFKFKPKLSQHLEPQSWHPNGEKGTGEHEDDVSRASSLDRLRKKMGTKKVLKREIKAGAAGSSFEIMRKRTSKSKLEEQKKARDAAKSDLFARLDREEDEIAAASGPLMRRSIPKRSKSDASAAFGFEAPYKPSALNIRRSAPARSKSSTTGAAASNFNGELSVTSFAGFSKPEGGGGAAGDKKDADGSLRNTRTTKKLTPVVRNNQSFTTLKFNASGGSLLSPEASSNHSVESDSFAGEDFDFE
mmetsp:Transcript_16795/g.47065  ORF Transcript_16795/g.47065 Transcript_16795/m.47065 type:complete len:446 (+) Transcript_16795:96-1433(+)